MIPPEDQLPSDDVIDSALSQSVAGFLADPDIRKTLTQALKEAGCSPVVAWGLVHVLKWAAAAAGRIASETVKAWLNAQLEKVPGAKAVLNRLATLTKAGRAKADVLAALRQDLKLPDGAPLPDDTDFDTTAAWRLHSDLKALAAQLDGLGDVVREALKDQEDALAAPPLGWALQLGGPNQSLTDSLRYNSGRDAFIGRDDMIDLMDRFCGDPTMTGPQARFSWMTLIGDGGEGKTRFALEYTRLLEAGGRWRAGRLSFDGLREFKKSQWRPAWPTFIVIDYAAQDPKAVHDLLVELTKRAADETCAPVRVLLLERNTQGEWFRLFNDGASGDAAAVRNYGFFLDGKDLWRGFPMPPLVPGAIVELMTRRLQAAGAPFLRPDALWSAASSVDPRPSKVEGRSEPRPRPLFALAVAALLADTHLRGEDLQAAITSLKPDDVLRDILLRDRAEFWLPAADRDTSKLEPFENLAALATLSGGFLLSDLNAGASGAGEWLPPHPGPKTANPLKSPILDAMGLARADGVAPLEPDLLGARFVFDRLKALQVNGCGGDRALINSCWSQPLSAAMPFAFRALRDAPQDLRTWGFLAPDVSALPAAKESWATIAIDFIDYCGRTHDWESAASVIQRFRALNESVGQSEHFAVAEAQICVNIALYRSEQKHWHEVDSAFARMETLLGSYQRSAAIAEFVARACMNAIAEASEQRMWGRCDVWQKKLDRLLSERPDNLEILNKKAASLSNECVAASKHGHWPRFDDKISDLLQLGLSHPANVDVAYCQAVATSSELTTAAQSRDWVRADIAIKRFGSLNAQYPNNPDIADRMGAASTNEVWPAAEVGNWSRVDGAIGRLYYTICANPNFIGLKQHLASSLIYELQWISNHKKWDRLARNFDLAVWLTKTGTVSRQTMTLTAEVSSHGMNWAIRTNTKGLITPARIVDTIALVMVTFSAIPDERRGLFEGSAFQNIRYFYKFWPNIPEVKVAFDWVRGILESRGHSWANVPSMP